MDVLVESAKSTIEKGIEEGFVLEVEKKDHIVIERGVKLYVSVSTNIIKKEGDRRKGDVFETVRPESKVTEIGDFVVIPNYYAILPLHLLVVSKDFVHQISRISLKESDVLSTLLNGDNVICFNGGPCSGASQLHRHFHLVLSLDSHSVPLGNLVKKGLFEELFPTSAIEFYSKSHEDEFMGNSISDKPDCISEDADDESGITLEEENVESGADSLCTSKSETTLTGVQLFETIRRCEKKAGIRICTTLNGDPLVGWAREDGIVNVVDQSCSDSLGGSGEAVYYLDDFSLVCCKHFCALFPRPPRSSHGKNLNSLSFTGCVFVKNMLEYSAILKDTILGTLSLATLGGV